MTGRNRRDRWERRHGGRTVLLVGEDGQRWTLVRVRLRDRLRARWRALSLDARLANGERADIDRLLAVRAGMLVAPSRRRELATGWERVLTGRFGRWTVPVQRSRALAAADEIRELVDALRVPQPVPARGVAIADLLLTDGTGPLFHPGSRLDLAAAVRVAVQHLDPCRVPRLDP